MISIIIVSFNTRKLTRVCLVSVEKFVDLKKHEVIVVDNGSEDESVRMIKKNFPFVKLVENRKNLGFSKANNQGIKEARGDYVFLLNSDTEFIEKGSLEKLVEVSRKLEDVGAIAPRLLNFDRSVQDSVFYLPTIVGAVKKYWLGMEGFGAYIPKSKIENQNLKLRSLRCINSKRSDVKCQMSNVVSVEAAMMAAMLIPHSTFDKIGLLDEGYHMYYEDLDYCRRIKQVGLKVYYVPGVEIVHHHGASGKKLVKDGNQWKRLIPSSKRYHGLGVHWLISFVIRVGQKFNRK